MPADVQVGGVSQNRGGGGCCFGAGGGVEGPVMHSWVARCDSVLWHGIGLDGMGAEAWPPSIWCMGVSVCLSVSDKSPSPLTVTLSPPPHRSQGAAASWRPTPPPPTPSPQRLSWTTSWVWWMGPSPPLRHTCLAMSRSTPGGRWSRRGRACSSTAAGEGRGVFGYGGGGGMGVEAGGG